MRSYIYKKAAVLVFAVVAMVAGVAGVNAQDASPAGTIKVGLGGVKTGAVGDGVNAQELAAAIQNTLGEYLKGSKVELVPLEAKLASAMVNEAKEKGCDYMLYAQVSHKKGGGGGFGKMFSAVAPMMSSVIPMAGGMGGAIAGSVVSTAVSTAASTSMNVKAKDEITLDIKLQKGDTAAFAKQWKAKAKSEGEDIISPMIEQAAQGILDAVSK